MLLPPIPDSLAATRTDLHRLAAYVIGPARYRATGRFGLRATPGGFGTPPFDGRRIRVVGTTLVDERPGGTRTTPITTLAEAAEFLESEVDPDTAAERDSPAPGDPSEQLRLDAEAVAVLALWYQIAFDALTTLISDESSADASRPQLWPGHFDPAVEMLEEPLRASYGASPGDADHPEPYCYVALWYPDRAGIDLATDPDFWNGSPFTGRLLPHAAIAAADDPTGAMLQFWRETRDTLRGVVS